jgi:hypothetical protein
MSTLFILVITAWTVLILVAFLYACAQATLYLLPPLAGRWQEVSRVAPTLADLRKPA